VVKGRTVQSFKQDMGNRKLRRTDREDMMMSKIIKYVMTAIVGLSLVLINAPAFAADVTGKTSTQTLPTQTDTQTAPLPSKTRTAPLPSNVQETREYQQVDKPPVQKLDIPDWDLAGELRNVDRLFKTKGGMFNKHKVFNGLRFKLALMNKGKLKGSKDIPFKVTVLNVTNNTVIKQENHSIKRQTIRNDMWTLTDEWIFVVFGLGQTTAPSLGDVKLIVDIDPRNTFGEEQRHRGNNRCEAHW